jgi:hypothetical protein
LLTKVNRIANLATDGHPAAQLDNCLPTRDLCQFAGRAFDLAWQLHHLRIVLINARFQV